ncbi:MAG: hypothetical protein OXG39_03260 [Chloroflexi bacterium]|nr:hypothetical protein [Chloroflexota bacterium]
MHQHIFKVGWLLTHNRNTTVVFYYTAFLPGVVLHELCRWLTAGILNVRATRSAQLPEHDEIGELQLSLVQISPNARAHKQMIIEGTPVIVAFASLWLIATDVLDLESSLRIATGGSVADIGRAIGSLVRQPDFWLWFYLMFTIANTMLPPISKELRNRRRMISALILTGAFAIGLGSNIEGMAILGSNVRRLLSSLSFILFATSIINVVMVLALGLLEAIIERVTGHSATFDDGKMITRTRQQALAERGDRERKRRSRRTRRAASKPQRPIRSIYALPLPIPGPPGKEPVSKPVAAVLNVSPGVGPDLKSAPDHKPASIVTGDLIDKSRKSSSRPKKMPETIKRSGSDSARGGIPASRQQPATDPAAAGSSSQTIPEDFGQDTGEHAPFSRPFAASPDDIEDPADIQDMGLTDLGFSRPFAPPQDLPPTRETEDSDSDDALRLSDKELPTSAPNVAIGRPKPKTRPVPKPSQRSGHGDMDSEDIDGNSGELRYEPLDDVDIYDDGEEFDEGSS